MPTRPWRGSPIRKPTAASISPGSTRTSRSAKACDLASLDEVAPTEREVATTSLNNTTVVYLSIPPLGGHFVWEEVHVQ